MRWRLWYACGTDHDSVKTKSLQEEHLEGYLCGIANPSEQQYEIPLSMLTKGSNVESDLENFSSEMIWARSKEGLLRCIEKYAAECSFDEISMLTVYKPELLIRSALSPSQRETVGTYTIEKHMMEKRCLKFLYLVY